jgi:hypothetical protein
MSEVVGCNTSQSLSEDHPQSQRLFDRWRRFLHQVGGEALIFILLQIITAVLRNISLPTILITVISYPRIKISSKYWFGTTAWDEISSAGLFTEPASLFGWRFKPDRHWLIGLPSRI